MLFKEQSLSKGFQEVLKKFNDYKPYLKDPTLSWVKCLDILSNLRWFLIGLFEILINIFIEAVKTNAYRLINVELVFTETKIYNLKDALDQGEIELCKHELNVIPKDTF